MSPSISSAFDIFNQARLNSQTLEEIWRNAYGNEYASQARPDAFYPQSVLDQIVAAAKQQAELEGQALLDIGCGHGLTGIYLADRLPFSLHGIDISPSSIQLAQQHASLRNLKASFHVADASSTGLGDGSCALVTCLDVLLYLPDKPAVLKEVHRILFPGGLFAFTTWEQAGYSSRLGAAQVEDYRPLLVDAGFEVVKYGCVEGAREQQALVFDGLAEREEALKEELGSQAAGMFVSMGRSAKEESAGRRYVFGLAKRV